MSTIADLPASAKMLVGSQYSWRGSQDTANREESFTWLVPWSDSNQFYSAVVGVPTTFTIGSTSINRSIPLQHPYNPRLWATKLSWQGQAGAGITPSAPFAYVIITVTFGVLNYNVGAESSGSDSSNTGAPPFIEISGEGDIRSVTDTGRQYSYTPAGGGASRKLQHDIAINYPSTSIRVTLHQLPDIDAWLSVIAPLEGMVNSAPVQIGSFLRATGTVLMGPYGWKISKNVLGDVQWTGELSFMCSSLPWNSYVIGGAQVALSPAPYQTADLNAVYM